MSKLWSGTLSKITEMAPCSFDRPHHQAIATVLQALDRDLLAANRCLFGGGTAITLCHGEYRESIEIDFLVSDLAGYRKLRQLLTGPTGLDSIARPGASLRALRGRVTPLTVVNARHLPQTAVQELNVAGLYSGTHRIRASRTRPSLWQGSASQGRKFGKKSSLTARARAMRNFGCGV